MAVSLGAHIFGCAYNEPIHESDAPKAEVRFEVAGLDGVGTVNLGKRSKLIQVVARYRHYSTAALLDAAIMADDAVKGGTPQTLNVDGVTRDNVRLLSVRPGRYMVNGVNQQWHCPDVVLTFEQMKA